MVENFNFDADLIEKMELNKIQIKTINKLDENIIDFLTKQSYNLYCKLKTRIFEEKTMNKIKDEFKKMYISGFNENDKIYIASKSTKIVGCAYVTGTGYLRDMFVSADFQKQNIGSSILEKIITDFKEKEIVLYAHKDVIDFYKKYDFIIMEENGKKVKMKR